LFLIVDSQNQPGGFLAAENTEKQKRELFQGLMPF
jgi:hypothetical protein